jgi:hypothetical protein
MSRGTIRERRIPIRGHIGGDVLVALEAVDADSRFGFRLGVLNIVCSRFLFFFSIYFKPRTNSFIAVDVW